MQHVSDFQFSLHEGLIDDHFGGDVAEFALLPCHYLLSHRLEIPLHPVDPDRDAIDQRERLRVLGQHGRKHTCDNISDPATNGWGVIFALLTGIESTFSPTSYPSRSQRQEVHSVSVQSDAKTRRRLYWHRHRPGDWVGVGINCDLAHAGEVS